MNKAKQPKLHAIKIICTTCGTEFDIHSTLKEIKVDVCSTCHPYYTGKQVGGAKAGRVERFNKKIAKK